MALPRSTSRQDLIRTFRNLGFEGPRTAGRGRHRGFMVRGTQKVKLPNPHRGDINVSLLSLILRNAGISHDEWSTAS